MDDLTLFIVGCGVSFLFGGGVLIHIVTNQNITDVKEPKSGPDSRSSNDRDSAERESE